MRLTTRGRRLELAVLAAGAVFLGILAVSFRPGRRPAERAGGRVPAPRGAEAGQATTLLDGFDFTESQGGKPLLRIVADRTIGYGPAAGLPPNLYAGEKVALTVYPDDGAPVVVHAERAEYDERTRESKLEGNVRWSDAEDSLAESARVLFHPASRTLESPGTVHFTRGTMDITAPSATYDVREKTLRLTGPIDGRASGDDAGGLSQLNARSGLYKREPAVLELENAQGASRQGDRFAADHLTLKLGTAGGRPEWARATGSVHGFLASGGFSSGAAPSPRSREYSGDESFASFDSNGKARALTLTGAPAALWEPGRRLTARRIEIELADGHARGARADGDVRIEEEGRRASADRGSLDLTAAGTASNTALEGNVSVEGDGRRGRAAKAVQVGDRQTWVLTAAPGGSARVESGASRLTADRIEIEQPKQQVRGEGRARAVFVPDPTRPGPNVSLVGDSKRPTFGKANRIVLDDAAHLATLSGSATLWQDESSVSADDITLSDAERTLIAVNGVRALMTPPREATSPPGGAGRPKPDSSVITAKRLFYRESDRTARFEGGVTMNRGTLHATGGESTAWLGKDRGVDCVEITGNVALDDRAAGRTGTADKVVDYPKEPKTIMWGSPARVVEAAGNRVAGAVLTILDQGHRVEVTAPEGGKTETVHKTTSSP